MQFVCSFYAKMVQIRAYRAFFRGLALLRRFRIKYLLINRFTLAHPAGIEPATIGLEDRRATEYWSSYLTATYRIVYRFVDNSQRFASNEEN